MKLFGSNTSSYVRKVRIQALEGGYWDQIDFFEMATAFWMRRCWRYEHSQRPELARWNDWSDGQMMKIDGALAEMEGSTASFGDRMDIGTITVPCALGCLDFRFATKDWRNSNTALADWFEVMMARSSVSGTVPPQ